MAFVETNQALQGIGAFTDEMLTEPLKRVLAPDNIAAISIASIRDSTNWRTTHLKVKAGGICQALDDEEVSLLHCPGGDQVADMGTKSFPGNTLSQLTKIIFMILPISMTGIFDNLGID